jgi:hypothetical protein
MTSSPTEEGPSVATILVDLARTEWREEESPFVDDDEEGEGEEDMVKGMVRAVQR